MSRPLFDNGRLSVEDAPSGPLTPVGLRVHVGGEHADLDRDEIRDLHEQITDWQERRG